MILYKSIVESRSFRNETEQNFPPAGRAGLCRAADAGLTACGGDTEQQSEAPPYLDGSYTARFDAAGSDGYTTYAVVEISGGKVSVREFDGRNDAGELRSADTALADSMAENASEYLSYEPTPANLSAQAIASLEAAGGNPDAMKFVAGGPQYGEELAVLVRAVLDGPAKAGGESSSSQSGSGEIWSPITPTAATR
ncbi:MAG: hypothetical protein V8Q30_05595 [Acutalibacteraceae bacterium]